MKKFLVRFREVDYQNFQAVVKGKKTVETRAATPKYQDIKPGDVLVMTCRGEKAEKIIKSVQHFWGLDQIFKQIDYRRIMPAAATIAEAKAVYDSYPGYREKLKKFGILAIELVG